MSLLFALPVVGLALSGLLSWGPAILMLGGLIFVHELGHFLVARWMGMPVEVFSLGFGPRVAGFAWQGTDVRLSALPLGGYVKLLGFNPEEPEAEDPHGFLKQAAWKRQLFYAGGILFNIATTLILLFILGVDQARITQAHPAPSPLRVLEVVQGSAAEKGGLEPGDEITAFGELRFPGATNDIAVSYIQARPGQPIPVTYTRLGAVRQATVVPQDQGGKGRIGIQFGPSRILYDRRPLQFGDLGTGALSAVKGTVGMGVQITQGFVRLFTFRTKVGELGGPISIARMGNEAAKAGWVVYLAVTAMISMNLAILNLLPIPFLDGGHMVILALERLRGKDFTLAVKERILTGGFVLLASLMILVMVLDVLKLRH
jgi:regulator of sigma E protease